MSPLRSRSPPPYLPHQPLKVFTSLVWEAAATSSLSNRSSTTLKDRNDPLLTKVAFNQMDQATKCQQSFSSGRCKCIGWDAIQRPSANAGIVLRQSSSFLFLRTSSPGLLACYSILVLTNFPAVAHVVEINHHKIAKTLLWVCISIYNRKVLFVCLSRKMITLPNGPSRTFRNLLEPSRTFQNLLEPSRTFQNLPEPSRTFRNLPEPYGTL